jgi:glycosyltransferase involved in cell wall biosynthesis
MADRPRLLYLVTEDWYFVSHRLALARAAMAAGFEVAVATRVRTAAAPIEAAGVRLFPLQHLSRSSFNPWREWRALAEITALYRRWQPAIVHHVAAKPVIYGGLAARRAGVTSVVSALAGLGFLYASSGARARLMRPLALAAYRSALRHPAGRLVVQNPDDAAVVSAERLIEAERVQLIEGSGVDTRRFVPAAEPEGIVTVILAGRMLWDKGVGEFVAAAETLKRRGVAVRCVLVGDSDPENPAAIPRSVLDGWMREGGVEWWGLRTDMVDVMRRAHVVCLPSYREGLPKVLLEAAASGRALIATDVPGCRQVVVDRETGLLVPPRDSDALAGAISALVHDAELRRRCGANARRLVVARFGDERVHRQMVDLYQAVLSEGGRERAMASVAGA